MCAGAVSDTCRPIPRKAGPAALVGLDVHAPDLLEGTELNAQLPLVGLGPAIQLATYGGAFSGVIVRSPADSIAIYLTLRGGAWLPRRPQGCTSPRRRSSLRY